jgi:hypothetical protein
MIMAIRKEEMNNLKSHNEILKCLTNSSQLGCILLLVSTIDYARLSIAWLLLKFSFHLINKM